MTDSEKITKLLDYYNLTPQRFAERIGLKQDTYIEDIISGKSGFRRALNMKIMKTYPEINQHWLISGEGEMILDAGKVSKKQHTSNQTIYARIDNILCYYGLSAQKFAESVGVNKQQVYDIMHGKCKNISRKLLKKIRETYPEINSQWLQSGEGVMIIPSLNNGDFGIQAIGNDNIITPTANSKIVSELLESKITLLQKDVELWRSKYESAQQLIESQKNLIEVLKSNSNA